jgi:hypothetical protein
LTKQKLAASSPYEAAKALEVDASPIYQILPKVADKVKFNSEASANVNELQKMVTDQFKGHDNLHNAGDLLGVRQRIDEMIKSAGSGQTVTPGADLYQLGSHTQTGSALLEIRAAINETLHSDPRMAIADSIFAGAEKQKSAFELGNKKIIGTGDNVIEPQLLAKQFASMPAEAKRAVLEGLARKGQNAIGDVRPNRNEGKAMADAFATENNLARLDAMGLNSSAVKNMAAREDAFASSNNRILGGSDTARTDITKQKFPTVGTPVGSSLDSAVNVGTFGLSALTKKGLQKIVDSYRFQKNNAAADLVSRQGPAATAVLDAIEKLNISKTAKSDIIKRLARQSAISGGTAQLTNSERR